jgi:hypothetical protein
MSAITIPGEAGVIERKKAELDAAVLWHFNMATAPPVESVRWPGAGDIGKRLTTVRLA